MEIYALMDCNNFYASCERVFNPSLRKKPLIILSNNDGCVIARSNEAKLLGIEMGEPVFKCEYLIKRHQVQMRSANFALYADLSQRVMSTLAQNTSGLEVYSIDEAFFSLGKSEEQSLDSLLEKTNYLRDKIQQDTGISVSIGLAQTKTLAKVANKIAKQKNSGVYSLYASEDKDHTQAFIDYHLADFALRDIWGLGANYCNFLKSSGFRTALDFKYADKTWLRQHLKAPGLRTCMELAGRVCLPLELKEKTDETKSIISSRTFAAKVNSLDAVNEAVANFVAIAAYKMRSCQKTTRSIRVVLRAVLADDWRGFRVEKLVSLSAYTNSSSKLIHAAQKAVAEIFDSKLYYKKAGVVFFDLKDAESLQIPLLDEPRDFIEDFEKNQKLNKLVDTINDDFGNNTVFWAAMGNSKLQTKDNWRAKQYNKSPSYTTEWRDLPVVF